MPCLVACKVGFVESTTFSR